MPDSTPNEKSEERSSRLQLLKQKIGQPGAQPSEATSEPIQPEPQVAKDPEPAARPAPPTPEPAPEQAKFSLPPGPPVKRKKVKGLKFTDRYETRSLSIDKRLLSAFDDFMEAGDTKTQVANQVVLKILLEAGYDIDPTILSKPFNKPGK